MSYYKQTKFNKPFIDILEEDAFPFTKEMVSKNTYSKDYNFTIIEISDISWEKFKAISIIEEFPGKVCRLDVLEVSKFSHIKKHGTRMLNYLKSKYDKIYLNSLDDTLQFYFKNGFKETEIKNELVWSKF